MKISQCYAAFDQFATGKQKKAITYLIDQNLIELFGKCEFDDGEAEVIVRPNMIEINDNIYGDDVTSSIAIEGFPNGLLCRSQANRELLFGIKRDNDLVIALTRDLVHNQSKGYVCSNDSFSYTVKDYSDGNVIYDAVMRVVGSRTNTSETFYLDVKEPKHTKKGFFSKKGPSGFVTVPIEPYAKLDEFDYLREIYEVMKENQHILTSSRAKSK
jgi:hypothetical protein